MNETLELYCIVTYLFTLGVSFAGWGYLDPNEKLGCVICLILSPATTPIILGVGYYKRNEH